MLDAEDRLSAFAAALDPGRRDRLALATPDGRLTFGELGERVAGALRGLTAIGVDRGVRVALPGASDVATVVTLLALAEARAVAVLLHPRLTPSESRALIERSRAAISLDAAAVTDVARPANRIAIPASRGGDGDDAFAIVFTSGSSGVPKGAVPSRRAVIASAVASGENLPFGSGDVWLSSLPLAHVGGLGVVTKMLVSGGAALLEPKFDPDGAIAAVAAGRATLLSAVPTTLDALLDRDRHGVLARLRAVLLGGAPASAALLERAAERRVLTLSTYGLTEACSQVTTQAPRDAGVVELGAGVPLPGTEVTILRENGSFCAVGEVGRIVRRGPTMRRGYAGGPGPPAAARDPEGRFDTGDIGELDGRGRLFVHARRTDLILTGGENVYPAEVEQAIEAVPGVRRAVVFGVPDPRWGELVAAAVEVDGARLEAVLAAVAPVLAPHKRPRLAAAVAEVAFGQTGKVDRRGARDRYATLARAGLSSKPRLSRRSTRRRQRARESGDRCGRLDRALAVRRVARGGDEQALARPADASLDRFDLPDSAVRVGVALDDERRDAWIDARQEGFDVPGAEGGVEPRLVPAPERAVDVLAVVARELVAQAFVLERLARPGDGLDRDVLAEDVGRDQREGGGCADQRRSQRG